MTITRKEQNKVLAALDQLDHENDAHWNKDGSPTVSVVAELSGVKVTKSDVAAVAPEFVRAPQEPAAPEDPANPEGEGDTPADQSPADNAPGDKTITGDDAEDVPTDINPTAGNPPDVVDTTETANHPTDTPQDDKDDEQNAKAQTEADRIQAQLDKANETLHKAIEAVAKARQEQSDAQNRVHALQNRLERVHFVHRDRSAATVAGYLASQQKVRKAQEDQYQDMKSQGLVGNPRSQLDKSMARRQGYGHQRPTVPPLFDVAKGKK